MLRAGVLRRPAAVLPRHGEAGRRGGDLSLGSGLRGGSLHPEPPSFGARLLFGCHGGQLTTLERR